MFTANWQTKQYLLLKENLPSNCVLMVMDFGRNRVVKHQNEAKEAGYGSSQITVHPVVLYYMDGPIKVRDSLIMLSDDINHDCWAVNVFLEKTMEYLKETPDIKPDRVVVFSDGCRSQYKGKGTVANISGLGFKLEWNYYGSDHGKGEADGERGCLTRHLIRLSLAPK